MIDMMRTVQKVMHAMPLNIGQRSDRAEVARRINFATRKSLNSQMAQNTKSPFSNPRAMTPKLYGHSRLTGHENHLTCKFGALLNSL
jgi:hypothetical protein